MTTPFIEYTTIDKSTWGAGPWLDEPDKVQWQDDATGLPCLAVRNRNFGHLCGYVGVDETHPLFGHDCDDTGLVAHGAVNFSEVCSDGEECSSICHVPGRGDPDHVWWFGFHCGQYNDLSPAFAARERRMFGEDRFRDEMTYRTLDYVKGVCANLARLLKAE